MKILCSLVLILGLAPIQAETHRGGKPAASNLTTYITQVIPLVIVGDGWSQRIVLQNVDDKYPSSFQLSFFTQQGQPLTVSGHSTYNFVIQPGKSMLFDLPVSYQTQQLGWALIQEDVNGVGDMFGQVLFRKSTPGLPDFMCSMILGGQGFEKLTAFFDNTNGNSTGMGVLLSDSSSLSTGDVSLRVTVRDISGAAISQKNISQKHRTLNWMNLANDYPETKGRTGTFEVEIVNAFTTTLTGVSIQFAGNGAFTVVTPFEY